MLLAREEYHSLHGLLGSVTIPWFLESQTGTSPFSHLPDCCPHQMLPLLWGSCLCSMSCV